MTDCGNLNVHAPHTWAIEANPGEDGPDYFQCPGRPHRRYFDHDTGCVLDMGHHPAPCLQGGIGKPEQLWDCKRCEDSGWVDCDTPWCTDDSHGGICSCPAGKARGSG